MDELFEIPVLYKGQELLFPARLLIVGYVHKFVVTIDKQEFFFERTSMLKMAIEKVVVDRNGHMVRAGIY
jgi:signal-transduction protein with cAMP-binding, CBS, and nucleotidyltransferase domain